MLIWDRGSWYPEGDPRESYRRGVLKFRLDGQKLHGAWTLVRMQHRREKERENGKENWLLIKERDGEAKAGAAEIVETLTDSVESGRGLKEVEAEGSRVNGSPTALPRRLCQPDVGCRTLKIRRPDEASAEPL